MHQGDGWYKRRYAARREMFVATVRRQPVLREEGTRREVRRRADKGEGEAPARRGR